MSAADPLAWMDSAACKRKGTDLFFPGQHDKRAEREAKAICHGCPVRGECLEYGLPFQHGIFGGTTGLERRRLRVMRRRLTA